MKKPGKAEPPKNQPPARQSPGWDPTIYATKNLPAEDVNKIKQCFDIFDTDKSGLVSIQELVTTIKALGLQEDAKKIFDIVTAQTKVEELSFQLFLEIFGFGSDSGDSSWQTVYECFDVRSQGCFTTQDFAKACESVGEKFTDTEYEQMIEYADRDRDGGITFQEFMEIINKEYPKV